MSFSQSVKNEITKKEINETEMIAELSAIIRINGSLILNSNHYAVDIHTENAAIARHVFSLIKKKYNLSPILLTKKKVNLKKNNIYIVRINKDVDKILADLSITDEHLLFNSAPKKYLVDDRENISSYLRGAFLASGSVNDPRTSMYHLEITVSDEEHANFVCELMNQYELNAKILRRKKGYIIYIKEAEKISDFLGLINANKAVLYFEDIRIYRDHKNMTNRLNNCEQANVEKSMTAAKKQINNINIIKKNIGLDILDEKLQELCEFRLKYEDASLQELSEIISRETNHNISKSGLNHRFKKISKIAEKYQ